MKLDAMRESVCGLKLRYSLGRRTFISGHENMGLFLKVGAQQVPQRVVFLFQGEVGRVGHAFAVG